MTSTRFQRDRTLHSPISPVLSLILDLEPIFLAMVLVIFWFPDLARVNSLLLLIPVLAARLALYRRLFVLSTITILLCILLALATLNLLIAPFQWGSWILGRPLMGVLLALSFADRAKRGGQKALDSMLFVTALLGVFVGVIALLWSQWSMSKSHLFADVIAAIPSRPPIEFLHTMFGSGFNVNEIAGGMSWLTPLLAGLAILDYRTKTHPVRGILAVTGFVLLAAALMLGQSRFAILGTVGGLAMVAVFMIPRKVWRAIALIALSGIAVFEILLLAGLLAPNVELQERDEASVNSRLLIWSAGIDAIRDYPFTGLGLNKFRAAEVRAIYPVMGYENSVLPHAHNELIQIGTDMGIPGIVILIALYIEMFRMSRRAWRNGHHIVLAVLAGLVAHALFGLGDAVTLFDRLIFIFWWLVGLLMAVHIISTKTPPPVPAIDVE